MDYRDWWLFSTGLAVLVIVLTGILLWVPDPGNPAGLKIMLSVATFGLLVTFAFGCVDYTSYPEDSYYGKMSHKEKTKFRKHADIMDDMMKNVRDVKNVNEYSKQKDDYTTLAQLLVKHEIKR